MSYSIHISYGKSCFFVVVQHPFVSQPRPTGILLELIERTKQAVRALDNMNYRKMKKMIMGDPTGELSEEGDSSIAETEDDDDKSEAVSYCQICMFVSFHVFL